VTGCHSWEPTTLSAPELLVHERPSAIRVTLSSEAVLTIKDLQV